MGIVQELFGKSPFGPLVEHTKKVHECVEMVWPLLEALVDEDYAQIRVLQDKTSRLEFEADTIKHAIRKQLPRRYFMPVDRADIDSFLHCQDKIADKVEDFAIILMIRKTKLHPDLHEKFFDFVNQVFQVTGTLLAATVELKSLADSSFGGAEAREVLGYIEGLGEEEWKADRMARQLSIDIYNLESELDPITIMFYEKMLITLGQVANEAENAGDMLRNMIVK